MSLTITFTTTAADRYGNSSDGIVATDNDLFLGRQTHPEKVWIPFVVSLPRYQVIVQATLWAYATVTRSDTPRNLVGCEDADNPSAPTTWADLDSRVMTTGQNNFIFPPFTIGELHSYDVTAAVQEVLDRPGWASGNTLAVMFHENGSSVGEFRKLASFENATYDPPYLEVIYPRFIGGMTFF
jgi:hypothetical protein